MQPPNESAATESSALHAARAALQRGDLRRADDLFRERLASTPDDADCLGEYGVFCLRTGRAATACYLLYKANELRRGDVEFLVHLGYARLEVEDFERARSSFEAALALTPEHVAANYGHGLCLQHAQAWTEAAADFAKAFSAAPDALPILLNLAEALHRAGDVPKARAQYEQALRMAPDDPAVWLACGKFLRESGDFAGATGLIDRCLRRDPNEPLLVLEKARCLREAGDAGQALRWLDRLETIQPTLADCHEEYGNCLLDAVDSGRRKSHWLAAIDLWIRAQEFDRARSLLDRLLVSNPASAAGWNSLGILENACQRLDAAEAAYRKAIAIEPVQLDAPANLAQLYETTNRLDEAKTIADDALRLVVGGEQTNATIELYVARARVARRQRDYTLCKDLLDRIDTFNPTPSQRSIASFERGKLMDLSGDPDAAIAGYTRGNAIALEAWQRENPGRNKALAGTEYVLDLVQRGWLREWKRIDAPATDANLAFLVGFPRSGTTLLNLPAMSCSAVSCRASASTTTWPTSAPWTTPSRSTRA
jgi:tetratricopeptide (TPR) repeat protein